MKNLIASLALCSVTAFSVPAFAGGMMECNAENLSKITQDAVKITDQAVLTTAMQDLALASNALAAGKADECATHLDKVVKATLK